MALTSGLALTGCTAASVSSPTPTSTTDAAADSTTPSTAPTAGQVIGTAGFTDGGTAGVLTISSATGDEGCATDYGCFTMQLTDFDSDDLFHLNPSRSPSPRDRVVYADETLDLDRVRR